MDKLYTIQEVAIKLNLSDKTLRRWEEAGRFLPSRTLGNQRRYSIEDLQILDAIKHGTINEQKDLLTIHDAAKICGVTPTTILRWENDGKIHPFITSENTYYQKSRLIEKMDELKKIYIPPAEPPTTTSPIASRPKLTPLPNLGGAQNQNNYFPFVTTVPTLSNIQPLLINIIVTLILLFSYHLIFNSSPARLNSPQPGTVKGASTIADPTLDLLRTILDPSGALTTTTLTSRSGLISPSLSLNPSSAPTSPTPGTIYYDASAQTLKVFKGTTWTELSPTYNFRINDATLITGTGTLHKGKNQVSVTQDKITENTPITVTFAGDYAPAKKYWVSVNQGSFTVYTDFPVSADSSFSYNLITPSSSNSAIIK